MVKKTEPQESNFYVAILLFLIVSIILFGMVLLLTQMPKQIDLKKKERLYALQKEQMQDQIQAIYHPDGSVQFGNGLSGVIIRPGNYNIEKINSRPEYLSTGRIEISNNFRGELKLPEDTNVKFIDNTIIIYD